jgi:hypothetical protein
MDSQDRRRYFRINDWVGLSYRLLDENSSKMSTDGDNIQISSTQVVKALDRELAAALNVLWQSNPAAANVIGLLNKKLDFIAAELELDYFAGGLIIHEQTQVNISACGIAFESEEPFNPGQVLELNLLLKPVNTKLKLQGCVNACDRLAADNSKPYLLRLDFVSTDTHVREELIQHIVRRQSMQLSKLRQDQSD